MTNPRESISRALIVLRRIELIMSAEKETNWIEGIRAILAIGVSAENRQAKQVSALAEMKSLYRTMHSGPGGFGEYFVWREDSEDRKYANEELDLLRTELWNLLGHDGTCAGPNGMNRGPR